MYNKHVDANRACISHKASGEQYLFMSWRVSLLKKPHQYHKAHRRAPGQTNLAMVRCNSTLWFCKWGPQCILLKQLQQPCPKPLKACSPFSRIPRPISLQEDPRISTGEAGPS